MSIKLFTIGKRGRQYFAAKLDGKYNSKVTINSISEAFTDGQVVALEVNDLSVNSRYGTDLKFEPTRVMTDKDVKQAKLEAEVVKHLKWARENVAKDILSGSAINFVMDNEWKVDGEALKTEITAFKADLAAAHKAQRAANEASRAAQEKQWATEKAERQEGASRRILFPRAKRPQFHVPVRSGSAVVVYTGEGKAFRINSEHPSTHGSHLLGYEGEFGNYCYYRLATTDEVTELEMREAEAAVKKFAKKRLNEIVAEIKKGEQPLMEGIYPIGEFINLTRDDRIVIEDDYIWSLYDTRVDNAGNFGDYLARRIPFDTSLAHEIRTLSAQFT